MKRKFVALFMIAIMALTVTTVAVTAKPVNAASTQAGAATGGSSNAKALNLVGLGVVGTPAVCFDQGGIFKGYVFERGTGGDLRYMTWNDQGSSSWMSLSGWLTSDPTVISTWFGEIVVSARGGDGALWIISTMDGGVSWSQWTKIGGRLLAGTGATQYMWTRAGLAKSGWFVIGTDHGLWAWDTLYGWRNFGGYLTSSPAVAASPSSAAEGKYLDVFARGGDGALWMRGYDAGTNQWSSWKSLGGQITSGTGPTACSLGLGLFDVFVQGTDRALWYKSYSGGWSGWAPLGGYLTSSPDAAPNGPTVLPVYVRGGGSGDLWVIIRIGNSWTDWVHFGG